MTINEHKRALEKILEEGDVCEDCKPSGKPTCNHKSCLVCFEIINANSRIITNCEHVYCRPCINKWMQTQSGKDVTCPFCRVLLNKLFYINENSASSISDEYILQPSILKNQFDIANSIAGLMNPNRTSEAEAEDEDEEDEEDEDDDDDEDANSDGNLAGFVLPIPRTRRNVIIEIPQQTLHSRREIDYAISRANVIQSRRMSRRRRGSGRNN